MNRIPPEERIVQFRNHLGLSQGAFSKAIGMSQPNVSKIESGQVEISDTFLYAMMGCFLANPEWIKSGQGEMLLSPEEYIAKGITVLGARRFHEGWQAVLKEPRAAEFRSLVAAAELVKEDLDPELLTYVQYILKLGQQGDEKLKHWLMVQLERAFPEVEEKRE